MIAWLAAAALAAQAEGAPPPEAPGEIDTDAHGAIEEVVVEASRMRLTAGEMPVNTTVLSELDVRESAWQPADQILRQVPGFSLLRECTAHASYCSTSERNAHFGLGTETVVDTLTLRWPSGVVQRLHEVPAGIDIALSEPLITADLLPAIIFSTMGLVSFMTGSNWGVFVIVLPIVTTLAMETDKIIVGRLLGVAEAGLYRGLQELNDSIERWRGRDA